MSAESHAKFLEQQAVPIVVSIVNGMDISTQYGEILLNLEAVVAILLLTLHNNDSRVAALALNEGLVPSIEERLALYAKTRS